MSIKCKKSNEIIIDFNSLEEISYLDFPKKQQLESKIFLSNIIGHPDRIVISDSLLIVYDKKKNPVFSSYEINTGNESAGFGVRGSDTGEILRTFRMQTNKQNQLLSFDPQLKKISAFNLNPNLNYGEVVSEISLSEYELPIFGKLFFGNSLDTIYLLNNESWDGRFTEIVLGDSNSISLNKVGDLPINKIEKLPPDISPEIFDCTITFNPFLNLIALIYLHIDLVEIYDLSTLELITQVHGPYKNPIKFKLLKYRGVPFMQPISRVFFTATSSEKYIYIILVNSTGPPDLKNVGGNIILQFDWDGNPIQIFELDQNVKRIAVDEKENKIFATTSNKSEIIYFNYDENN